MGVMSVLSKVGDAIKKGVGGVKPPAAPAAPAAPAVSTPKAPAAPADVSSLTAASSPAPEDSTSLTREKPKPKEDPDDDTELDKDKDKKDAPTDNKPPGDSEGSAESKAADTFFKMLAKFTADVTKVAMDYKNYKNNAKLVGGMVAKTAAAPVTLPIEAAKGIKEAGKATIAAGKELGADIADVKQKLGDSAVGQAAGKFAKKASDGMGALREKLTKQKEGPDKLEPGGKSMLPGKEKKENERNSVSSPAAEVKEGAEIKAGARKRSSSAPPKPSDPPRPKPST